MYLEGGGSLALLFIALHGLGDGVQHEEAGNGKNLRAVSFGHG